jgi:uncharacterized repeat protein (TIGR03803 family)
MKFARSLFHGAFFAALMSVAAYSAGVQSPSGDLLRAPDGNFYGTSREGGAFAAGTIFRVTPESEVTLLLSFSGEAGLAKGSQPRAGLIRDEVGNLWGTTYQGGAFGMGTVFKFNPTTRALTTVVEFNGVNGAHPQAALIADPAGTFWGTTARGGASDHGTVFSLNASNNAFATEVSFTGTTGAAVGSEPKAALLRDASGVLWGTTSAGGALNLGTIFTFDPAGPTFTSVLEFTGSNGVAKGAACAAALIHGTAGVLWGTTDRGGTADLGTVFKFNTSDSTLTTVVNFTGANGSNPKARLFNDGLGFFYGTAAGGGAFDQGTVFKVNAATSALTTLADLNGTSGLAKGSFPLGGLVPDAAGTLWGTASQGGREDLGTIFNIDLASGLFTLLAEPNPSPSLPSATVKPPPPSTTTGVAGNPVLLSGTAKDNVELLHVLVSLNGGPFVPATLVPPTKAGGPSSWQLSVIPENGNNVVIVKSIDSGGDASKPITLYFKYTVVRPELAGAYNGLALPTAASTTPLLHTSVFTLKALANGRFTGKITFGGLVPPVVLTGAFGNDGTARFGKTGASPLVILRQNRPPLALALAVDVDAPLSRQITGTLSEDGLVVATCLGDQALYTAKKNPIAPLVPVPLSLHDPATDKGSYTAVFRALTPAAQSLPATEFPQGDGYALGKLAPTGVMKWTGKLADGTPFSASNALSQDNVLPFFTRINGGAVSGFITFRDTPGESDADGIGLRWYKLASAKAPAYRAGWPTGIEIDLFGSKFVTPKLSSLTLLGNPPAANNAVLSLSSATLAPLANELSVGTTGPVAFGGAPAGASPANQPRITLLPTGAFLGSFIDPLNQKTTPFTGAVLQKAQTASGYFLAAPPAGSPTTDPKSSGLVEIVAQ